jgi:hypothetical protein
LIAADGGKSRRLDDEAVLRAALNDPAGLSGLRRVRYVPTSSRVVSDVLVRAVKSVVDESNTRGQFVLAGSTRS